MYNLKKWDVVVSTHSRLKAAAVPAQSDSGGRRFNTQPPEGGCKDGKAQLAEIAVSTHSRLKAADFEKFNGISLPFVSTHSRLKAAALYKM